MYTSIFIPICKYSNVFCKFLLKYHFKIIRRRKAFIDCELAAALDRMMVFVFGGFGCTLHRPRFQAFTLLQLSLFWLVRFLFEL